MGTNSSTCNSKNSDSDEKVDEKRLQDAFDEFVYKHCELGPGLFASVMDMQSAVVAYIDIVGLHDARVAWTYTRAGFMFDMFGSELKVHKSGVTTHPMLVGIRIKTWPHVKQAQ